ncbi:MAG: large-conductance mechanosensitive channel protein MscL [Salinivirgaceae bacterium]|jgi:large conductance mechanosensitive channel|nr:large-conductance mechanosensitive channel protein MscL [Bacteroidales bacterium]
MKFLKDFKAFALKGNVIDMAVGIIIGAAFGKIVTSLVNDIIMPPLGLLIGGVNFSDLKVVMKEATEVAPAVTLNYGQFIQVVFDFLIVAVAIFMLIRVISVAKRKHEEKAEATPAPAPEPSNEEKLLEEIRDILKNR